jgi:aspartyl-tRNA(Asn)/glutamyl-tRNA(Gln) amidotransferase subunit B
MKDYGLSEQDAVVLIGSKELATYYEACVALFPQPKMVSNWVTSELLRELKKDQREIDQCPVKPEDLANLLKLIDDGIISGKIAKNVFEEMYSTQKSPKRIIEEKGLEQVTDEGEIRAVIDTVVAAHPSQVKDYRKGKEKLLGFFVGQVMKQTRGKANPKIVNEILREKLSQ